MYATLEAVIRDLNQFPDAKIFICPASVGADEYGWAVVVEGQEHARAFIDDEAAESLIVAMNIPVKTLEEVI
jgi:hypothetical protein